MKITRLDLYHIAPRWLFLKISTDEGICGWGEPVLEGKARTVEAAVRDFEPLLIGQDPRQIEQLWQRMYRGSYYRGGPIQMSAISGIEQALLDIKGKYYHMPVYEMLGGRCRDFVRLYGHLKPTATAGDFPLESMLDIARRMILPAAIAYSGAVAQEAVQKKQLCPALPMETETRLLTDIQRQMDRLTKGCDSLQSALNEIAPVQDTLEKAQATRDRIVPAMAELRAAGDLLETMVGADYWPMPTYHDLMTSEG